MNVSQTTFHDALLDANKSVPDGLLDAQANAAGRRFSVYRNNVAVSLTEAMHQAFPVIAKLLGSQNMDGLAGIFLRQHPPTSPLMMFYGDEFPAFLEGMEQLSHLGYLPDVARLELALQRAYHAADCQPIDPDALNVPPEDLMRAKLTLAPAATVLRSEWPVHAIWLFNTEDGAPKPEAGAQDVLITRPEYDPARTCCHKAARHGSHAFKTGKTSVKHSKPPWRKRPSLTLEPLWHCFCRAVQ